MNDFSKITLSAEEQQLVNNTEWILTKRKIMDKVSNFFAFLAQRQRDLIEKEKNWLPKMVVLSEPKIAKGENYLQLPYMILDYPRCFDAENIFAIRTMFWWGNFFSITLHVSGQYKQMFQGKIFESSDFKNRKMYICVNESQWHHYFEADNYLHVNQLSNSDLENIIFKKSFLKLAIKFPLQLWDDIPELLDGSFKELIEMLKG